MRSALAVLGFALFAGCAGPSPYRNAEVVGTVTWREAIVYGPDATLLVYLIDVSGPESPLAVELQKLSDPAPGAELVAWSSTEGMIRSPTTVSLPVPQDKVDPAHDYALKAVILDQGKPAMATSGPPLVLTKGRPLDVELVVSPVAAS